ncbi:TetR/AcrR family transcriptional regulator C-terminal domain-containing protein [Actinomycetospora sp.]|jgi:DNA-binding transcriptional regulator YhcF (GntR family)|uniref:TetR/AcrR family transcriptional regulator C-terminal domain-containing protein n=1 Tax=Actinomycetospora sp. TaxID=1872135 RepID=UPI002F401723
MEAPPYARIVEVIRGRIEAGDLAPGERVPSTRGIVAEFGVAMATASKVLGALRRDGVVRVVPGVGTVVAESEATTPSRTRRDSPDAELGRAAIVRAAIRIADAEGIDALSMRRVAAALGAGAMSLYRHVPGKDELMLLMRDAVFAEFPLPAAVPPTWRAALELTARAQWRLYRRHPWLARTTSLTRPYAGPNQMPYSEWNLRALSELGLDDDVVFLLHLSLFSFVHGSAASLEAEGREEADTGLTGHQWLEQREEATRSVFGSGAFPVSARVFGAPDLTLDLDRLFEFGLARLLDGIEQYAAQGPPGSSSAGATCQA